ncbi:MAG TPA: thiamine pyrophosphate-dependent enzyme [Planctomycetaceae bacterium]|nr:thiamine pyrophosphate-dependent enzyme [Planctomycetaceae bacterium]
MSTAREIDRVEGELVAQGEAFFHVSGAGHEASAALARHLTPDDWLHVHYRDKALLLARGISPRQFFLSLLGREESHSAGRQMSAHLSAPELHVLSMVGPVGNNALQAVGVAAAIKDQPTRPIVVCSVGDGTTQQGEFFEAVAEAVRCRLPVLFLIEDNKWAISTNSVGQTFFSLPDQAGRELFGTQIRYIDGYDARSADAEFEECVRTLRAERTPIVAVLRVDRLCDHSNADDQTLYRDAGEIAMGWEWHDPVAKLRDQLAQGPDVLAELAAIDQEVVAEVAQAAREALEACDPTPIFTAKAELPESLQLRAEYRGKADAPQLTMREALNQVLKARLKTDPRVFLYGQDIEDPKGDVFGVTRGLSRDYPDRVRNSPLSEATIVGSAIGRALAGQRPVAFLQFADFLPLAANQIVSELGSMFWRTEGGWQCPVIVMITCGGYRPGLGPFHAQTLEALALHTPGIDVVMPSTAADAAGLLNAAFESPRPTLFFYPKSCLNLTAHATSADVQTQHVPLGRARIVRSGGDITFVSWGNPLQQCGQSADALAEIGISAEVIDLRSLSPWDEDAVLQSVEKTRRLIVVHEDNQTCGFGAEVLARVTERARGPVVARRVARPDVYVPFHFASQLEVLPSYRRILETAAELLDLELSWNRPAEHHSGSTIAAVGSGPSDDAVMVVAMHVAVNDDVEAGQVVAEMETAKSVVDVVAPSAGRVQQILVALGETVRVGQPLIALHGSQSGQRRKPLTHEGPGIPVLKRRPTRTSQAKSAAIAECSRNGNPRRSAVATIVGLSGVTGGRLVTNEELLKHHSGRTSDDIIARTGIESRFWADEGESVLSMGVDACHVLFDRIGFDIGRLSLAIACTATPTQVTPSLACRVLASLDAEETAREVAAYDLNAACSAYMYALQAAWDHLNHRPDGCVLIVTSELLSRVVDVRDFASAFLFGDAATATLIVGRDVCGELAPRHPEHRSLRLHRPVISGRPENGDILSVPLLQHGMLQLKGETVYDEAVRSMVRIQTSACEAAGIPLESLATIIPHQANGRILKAVNYLTGCSVFNHMRHLGNTSSSSIPLALRSYLTSRSPGEQIGMCAFGGGFTYAAAVGEVE